MRGRHWIALGPLLAMACAQVGNITGGEQDTTPPALTDAEPPHLSTGFHGDAILLHFDERIQLDRVRDKLLVSPPLPEQPDVRLAGPRSVLIRPRTPLQANTTYTFMIGDAVKDLTEGNVAAGLAYVVSTGDHVDSMQVAGRVVNAFTGKPENDVLVTLHDTSDTLTIRTGRPTYAGRTNKEGHFHLRNLRPGTYAVHALRDKNANYRFDLPNEEIAFADGTLTLAATDTVMPVVELVLFQESSNVQKVLAYSVLPDAALRVVLARPAEHATLRDVARTGGRLEWWPQWNATRDTVLFWPSDTAELAKGLYELRTDSLIDTLRYRPVQRMPFFTGLWTGATEETSDHVRLTLIAARPIAAIDTTRFSLMQDSLPVPFTVARDTADRRKLTLTAHLPEESSATLTLLPKAVRDIYHGHNDTLRTALGRAGERSTGTLRVKVVAGPQASGAPLILQLLAGMDRVVRSATITGSEEVVWERITPGNHTLRVIGDRNANGRWDTGSLNERLQPEPMWRYPETVNIRAAWDIGVEWKLP
jgi:uncharacterized protein (DUF2141 family)